ncbi:MAG: class I adenylate cyclase [Desulfobacterales bacterium]|nr:class I adenylate cyclase [Desulfobacterales bacterium]
MRSNTRQLKIIQKTLSRNKRVFLEYNEFRKKIFSERTPKDSEIILYLIPWLFSINEPACPGYLQDLNQPFRVYNVEFNKGIRNLEKSFKKMFGVTRRGTLLTPTQKSYVIQGIYTIGSVGTVNQNSLSDCDIWVCFDKEEFDKAAWNQLNQKVNIIKGWLDNNIKLPVYFFISDVTAVKEGNFGSVDAESSGSAQQLVLKEEFYRTFILICGKIPIWWLLYNKSLKIEYNDALSAINSDTFWEYDLIDFGNIEKIKKSEYFGASLWQFHKFLTSPLKSIIKMVLLKMLLDAPQERLLCHQLREEVCSSVNNNLFPDHSLFTMSRIFTHYKGRKKELMHFLKMCFYIRCETKPYDKNQSLKGKLMENFLNQYPLEPGVWSALQKFYGWKHDAQIEFGRRLFKFMLQLYREISADNTAVSSKSDERDLTVLGRKISARYLKKKYKISILQKPTRKLNLSVLTFKLNGDEWQTFPSDDTTFPIISSKNIIENIAFIVWNDLFVENWIQMCPNPFSITLQEIINLGKRIKFFFGTYETLDIELSDYLKKEQIAKMLIVVGFDKSPWNEQSRNYGVIYLNNWGELYVRWFNSTKKFEAFLRDLCKDQKDIVISKYLKRNPTSFEKNIAQPKKFVFPLIKI